MPNCKTCSDAITCATCNTGYYRNPSVPSSCLACSSGCSFCTSTSNCSFCLTGYTWNNASAGGCVYGSSTITTSTTTSSSSSAGGISGGVVGIVLLIGIVVLIWYCCCRKKTPPVVPLQQAQMMGHQPLGGETSMIMGGGQPMGGFVGQQMAYPAYPGNSQFNPYSQSPAMMGQVVPPPGSTPVYSPAPQAYNPPMPLNQGGNMPGSYSNPQTEAWQGVPPTNIGALPQPPIFSGQGQPSFDQKPSLGPGGPNQNTALPPGFS